jgi:hypothetical protein
LAGKPAEAPEIVEAYAVEDVVFAGKDAVLLDVRMPKG